MKGKVNISVVLCQNMALGKRDLERKRKNLENKLKELEEKARKNPLNKALQEELAEFKKKLKEE